MQSLRHQASPATRRLLRLLLLLRPGMPAETDNLITIITAAANSS